MADNQQDGILGNKKKKTRMNLTPEFRLYLRGESGDVVVDQLDAMLLRRIDETGSITDAAKHLGISYRNAWGRMQELEKKLGERIVRTTIGGEQGGGTELTESGEGILREFRRVRKYLFNALGDVDDYWEHAAYKLSARNAVRARIVSVEKGEVTSKVTMQTAERPVLTSVITTAAVVDLDLKVGDEVSAIIKSTEVMIAKKSGKGK